MKILIIDDEGPDRKGMAVALAREGYQEVIMADTAEAGIEMTKSFQPDVIFIDVVLNGINGLDVCRQIRDLPDFKGKIIMITGHLDAVNAKHATSSGADEIIEKTIGFSNIGQTVRDVTG